MLISFVENLTLTSVVFELDLTGYTAEMQIFNFNKCCIWIPREKGESGGIMWHLTLTSVVFELASWTMEE